MARTSIQDPFEKFRFKVTLLGPVAATSLAATPTISSTVDPLTGAVTSAPSTVNLAAFASAGFHDVQMPKRTTTKGTYRQGNFPDVHITFPGTSTMEDIVLNRGLTNSTDFYSWAQLVHSGKDTTSSMNVAALGSPANLTSLGNSNDFRKDLAVSMLDRTGKVVKTWNVYNAWPVHFTPGSDLNASEDGEKSMESLTLSYEDFEEVL
jgi:phage tail-like protein